MLPSSAADFADPEIVRLIGKSQQSPVAEDRVKFFELARDAIGSEFASRHGQYEMFYAGATFAARGHSFRNYDWQSATAMVDRLLGSYSLEGIADADGGRRRIEHQAISRADRASA